LQLSLAQKEVQATVEGIGCKYKPEGFHLIKWESPRNHVTDVSAHYLIFLSLWAFFYFSVAELQLGNKHN